MTTDTDERPGPPPPPELVTYEILPDDYSDSPRGWDNLGVLACYESNGLTSEADCRMEQTWKDVHADLGWEGMVARIKQDVGATVVLPVNSTFNGVSIASSESVAWDGIIYDTEENRKMLGATDDPLRIKNALTWEVETLAQWKSGDVYQYVIATEDGTPVEGCGGYYEHGECIMEASSEARAINNQRFKKWKEELDSWDQAPQVVTISRESLVGKQICVHDVVYEVASFTGHQVHLQKVKQ